MDRFLEKIEFGPGCWRWLGAKSGGYGVFHLDGRTVLAHRQAFQRWVGPIPPLMTVDHICFERSCQRPDHLRLLTRSANAARQRPRRPATRCRRGHPYDATNTIYSARGRRCRTCRNRAQRDWRERRRHRR